MLAREVQVKELYHFTNLEALDGIVELDKLGHSRACLTRTYLHDFHKKAQVVVVLNRKMIRNNFNVVELKGSGHKYFKNVLQDEQEEKVTEPILNLHEYLEYFVIDTKALKTRQWAEYELQIEGYCHKFGIDLFSANLSSNNWPNELEIIL